MHSVRDRVSQAAMAQLDSQLSTTAMLADKAVDSIERLSDLHLNLARATFEQSNLVARQLAAAENARQFFQLAAAQARPNSERVFDYGYYLANIASSAQEAFIKEFGMRIADCNRRLLDLLADLDQAALPGVALAEALVQSVAGPAGATAPAPREAARQKTEDAPPMVRSAGAVRARRG
ncbi:phasin family protein [Noviherbaspirillum sp. UKPF54]|uniref:phasin family protein n=1 Tax=Noviherbaspirillum sp. UKPF54 TaxID=2601898 RepID=UPI00143D5D5F|nr:phasin family protein [Noviherbaspirillum sp. UKPF54]